MDVISNFFSSWNQWECKNGVVTNKVTGKVYGHHSNSDEIQYVLIALAIIQMPLSLGFRIPYRLGALLSGDFFRAGYSIASKEWHIERQNWFFDSNTTPPPTRITLCQKIVKSSLIELIKNISKIASYPIASIGLQFSCILGLFYPYEGRALFAGIEDMWARNITADAFDFELAFRISEYFAICMQSKDVYDCKKMYSFFVHKNSPQDIYKRLSFLLKENVSFFNKEGLDVSNILKLLEELTGINKQGKFYWFSRSLKTIEKDLNFLQNYRYMSVELFIKRNSKDIEQIKLTSVDALYKANIDQIKSFLHKEVLLQLLNESDLMKADVDTQINILNIYQNCLVKEPKLIEKRLRDLITTAQKKQESIHPQ